MKNDLPAALSHPEAERDAYNAAFYELGLRWHWDEATHAALVLRSPVPEARIRFYMEQCHPHLLSVYDPAFLAAAVQERVLRQKSAPHRNFDWALATMSQVGS